MPKSLAQDSATKRLTLPMVWEEPFRVLFVVAMLAGLVGALIWPLHFIGWLTWYPGVNHARIMTQGFFGAFIIGFLGTAMPRMLSAPGLSAIEVSAFCAIQLALIAAHATARTALGDLLFLLLLLLLAASLAWRFFKRRDMPPPGFVLVGLAILCGMAGSVLALLTDQLEDHYFWLYLRPLLQYQGFILLPILGVGGFILPRFFHLPSRQEFAESRMPPPGWTAQALCATAVGLAIVATFVMEAGGRPRTAGLLRFCISTLYLYWQVPFYRSTVKRSSLAWGLRVAFLLLPAGFLAISLFPRYRVGMLHLTLIGGFSVLTLCVATRVVLGHAGHPEAFDARHRWLSVAVVLMLVGMVTRISGDYWPNILVTHYSYGAILWAAGLLLWAFKVLPAVRKQ